MKKNKPYFYAILLALPFALLALLEIALRVIGVGQSIPLVVENAQFPTYLHINPNIIQRYFANPDLAPKVRPDIVLFEKNKSPDTFRIVVQGASTAAGFPYGRDASLQGMLNQRFKRWYPEKKIEVISTAMAAVNSYTMLDFADEIVALDPDLIVIYAGHNEYLGVMGVGSNYASFGGRSTTLLYIKLRSLRLYQLMEKLVAALRPAPEPANDQRSLMASVAREKNIPYDSSLYHKGITQFSKNLASLLKRYQREKIPVLIANLVSNEKDQVPFSSVGEVDWLAFKQEVKNSAKDALAAKIAELRSTLGQEKSAANFYKLGLLLHAAGDYELARENFRHANDYDQLRFRAPRAFQTIISSSAEKYSATWVDVDKILREDIEDGIIGNELMLEHLHPNARGYFLLAEAFAQKIRRDKHIADSARNFSTQRAWPDNPLSELAKLEGDQTIQRLTRDYPFVASKDKNSQPLTPPDTSTIAGKALSIKDSGVDWLSFQQRLVADYKSAKNLREAARIAANTSDTLVNDVAAAMQAGELYSARGDHAMAVYYYSRAVKLAPKNREALTALTSAYFSQDAKLSNAEVLQKIKRLQQ